MSDFVDQCRREWKRLGVPNPVAEEMAADLASDIREAEADGVTIEELLGSSASDPRAFAASWAGERGLLRVPSRQRSGGRRGRPVLIAFTIVASVALIVAVLLLATGEPKVSLVTHGARPPHLGTPNASYMPPPGRVQASAAAPIEWILLFVSVVALGFSAWLWSRWARPRSPIAAAQ